MRINRIREQPTSLTPEKARIVAHLKADGCILRGGRRRTMYTMYLEMSDMPTLQRFEQDVFLTYGLQCKWILNRSGKKPTTSNWRVCVNSILAFQDLQQYGKYYSHEWDVPPQIINGLKEIQKEFLRTFFDDEGTVIIKKKIVRLYSTNKEGLLQIQKLLEGFSIHTKLVSGYGFARNVYALRVKISCLKTFAQEIGFSTTEKREKLEAIVGRSPVGEI